MAKTSVYKDSYTSGSPNPVNWAVTPVAPAQLSAYTFEGTDVQAGGVNTLTPAATTDRIIGRSSADAHQDMTSDGVFFKIPLVAQTVNGDFHLWITNNSAAGANRSTQNMRFSILRNFDVPNLEANYNNAGSGGSNVSVPYSSSAHVWIRIREAAGDIVWDVAPEGVDGQTPGTWSEFRRLSTTGGTYWTPDDVEVFYGIHNWNGQALLTYSVDNYNGGESAPPPPPPPAPASYPIRSDCYF